MGPRDSTLAFELHPFLWSLEGASRTAEETGRVDCSPLGVRGDGRGAAPVSPSALFHRALERPRRIRVGPGTCRAARYYRLVPCANRQEPTASDRVHGKTCLLPPGQLLHRCRPFSGAVRGRVHRDILRQQALALPRGTRLRISGFRPDRTDTGRHRTETATDRGARIVPIPSRGPNGAAVPGPARRGILSSIALRSGRLRAAGGRRVF